MEIIVKKENDITCFVLNGESLEFNYDSFNKLIDTVYSNDDEITFDVEENLEEYQKLLRSIIEESRKEDFREAVNNSKIAKKKLDTKVSEVFENQKVE